MGKTSRKTLAKKKDFNKVKLKVGKKKPLANNATETSFKSQSIYLKEQLKTKNQLDNLNQSTYNISDLLSHLNHFNASFRFRALNALKEALASNHSNALYATSVVEKVSKCVMDDDDEVRKACIGTLQHVFMDLPETKMSPYFPLVLSHLYCAMSHLSKEVQRDSLKVVDLILQHYPNLVSNQANTKLLEYFLELISTKENGNAAESRTLTMQLSLKKESATTWRNRVLSRIHTLLRMSAVPVVTSVKKEEKKVLWNHPHIDDMLVQVCCQHNGFLLRNLQRSDIIATSQLSQEELITTVTPILIQCWLEVYSNGVFQKDAETFDTMYQVLSITYTMCMQFCKCSEDTSASISWLRKTFLRTFNKHFFEPFPIVQPEVADDPLTTSRKNRKSEGNFQKTVVKVNLLICNLFAFTASNDPTEKESNKISSIVDYLIEFINTSLTSSLNMDNELFESMMSCVEKLVRLGNIKDLHNSLISSLYEYCLASKCNSYQKGMILRSVMELFEQLHTLPANSSIYKILSDLPSHLLSALHKIARRKHSNCKIDQAYLKSVEYCVQCAVKQRNEIFLQSLSKHFVNIMSFLDENSSDLFCCPSSSCPDCCTFQISLLENTIPLVQSLTESDFNVLSLLCKNDHVTRHASYVIDLLAQRVDSTFGRDRGKDEKICFLKFLFTLLLGGNHSNSIPACMGQLSRDVVRKHSIICDHICGCLKRFCIGNPGLKKLVGLNFLTKLDSVNFDAIKERTALGILKLGKVYTTLDGSSSTDYCVIGRFITRLLLNAINCEELNEYMEVKKCIVGILKVHTIMESCLRSLTESESSRNIITLTTLMKIDELQEYFVSHASVVNGYIERIEKLDTCDADGFDNLKTISSILI